MRIIAMSDLHGRCDLAEKNLEKAGFSPARGDVLVLCGDYLAHDWQDDICDLAEVMDLQSRYPEGSVICLMGNHEADWLAAYGDAPYAKGAAKWVRELPLFYESEGQVFVHAGIDETAKDLWRVGTPDDWFVYSFPPSTGTWDDGEEHAAGERSKDIVAGHVAASNEALGGRGWGGKVFWDGENHFYIDGATELTGVVPMLVYDCDTQIYHVWDAAGERREIARR